MTNDKRGRRGRQTCIAEDEKTCYNKETPGTAPDHVTSVWLLSPHWQSVNQRALIAHYAPRSILLQSCSNHEIDAIDITLGTDLFDTKMRFFAKKFLSTAWGKEPPWWKIISIISCVINRNVMAMSAVDKANITIADTRINHCDGRLLRTRINMQVQNKTKWIPVNHQFNRNSATKRLSLPYRRVSIWKVSKVD